MKIALFVHCFFPDHFYGTETYTLQLAQRMQEAGHAIVVVTAVFPGEKAQDAFVRRYRHAGIDVVSLDKNRLPNTRVKDTYYQEEMREPLRDVLRAIAPDIVHVTHLINHTGVLPEVAAELDIPCFATLTDFFGFCYTNKLEAADGSLCHGPDARRMNCLACHIKAAAGRPDASAPLRWAGRLGANRLGTTLLDGLRRLPGYRRQALDGMVEDIVQRPDVLARCLAHYAAVIAPTRFLQKAYVANGFERPMVTSRFGIDFDRRPKEARPAGSPPVFGFIGQLAPHKGTDVLIRAFRQLPAGSATLLVYGPTDQDPAYMASLEVLAGPGVAFRGTFASDRTREILDAMDVLVIPSLWYENSPLVLLNALASHTPVVVSDVEGLTEFITEGVDGFAFERGDVAALTAVLQRFVDDAALASRMSAATRYERTTAAMADEVLALYASHAGEGSQALPEPTA